MPTLLSESRLIVEFADLALRHPIKRPSQPLERADCAHQSDILSFIARKINKLGDYEQLEEDIPDRMLMGQMWEEFYFSMVPDTIWQPGEMILDGIAVNADGLAVFDTGTEFGGVDYSDVPYFEETKCTEKSARSGERFLEEWMWMHQGREYAKVYLPEADWYVGKWTILYYRGAWSKGTVAPAGVGMFKGPLIMQYVVQFTKAEVDQTHKMLLANLGEAMGAKRKADVERLEKLEVEARAVAQADGAGE